MSIVSDCSSRSCFVWTVERPFANRDRDSPDFTYNGKQFRLRLSLSANTYNMIVVPLDAAPYTIIVHVEDDEKRAVPLSYWWRRCSAPSWYPNTIWRYNESEILKAMPDFHSHGLLTFLVHFSVGVQLKNDISTVQTSSNQNAAPCLESLSEDLSKLLDHGPEPDLLLTCGDLKVKAHKIILCTRSDVFAAMLNSGLAETRTGTVEIRDMDQETFNQFVRYLYTGKLPDLTMDTARSFYETADKYAVKGLMRRCSRFLSENLDQENAFEMLLFADAHSDEYFKESIMRYILQKGIHLKQDDRWRDFCKSQPTMALEVANHAFKGSG